MNELLQHKHMVERVNQLYHAWTQDVFDDVHRQRHQIEKTFWNELADRILAKPTAGTPRHVVDLACGTGFVSAQLLPALNATDTLICLDLCTDALYTTSRRISHLARRHSGPPSVQMAAASATALPLAAESVHFVGLNAALHHVEEPQHCLREIDRVLKPGGWFALGFEPNEKHFASTTLNNLSRSLTRLTWYASPKQNWRRIRERLGLSSEHGAPEDVLVDAISRTLLDEGMTERALSREEMLDLVDPHARGEDHVAGFDPLELLETTLPDYDVQLMQTHDFLGASPRRIPVVRHAVDRCLSALAPDMGSLFCWLIRKPANM